MIDLIENLNLKENDVILVKVDKNEDIKKLRRLLSNLSKDLKLRFFGIIIPKESNLTVLSRREKIELKELLEKSLKEG